MTIEVRVNIHTDAGDHSYLLAQTAEAVEKKNGGRTLAHFQPTPDNLVVKGFSKLYLDLDAFEAKLKAEKKAVKTNGKGK